MAERVKLAGASLLSGITDTDTVLVESGGGVRRYSFADLKEAIISGSEKAMAYDDIMISYSEVNASSATSRLAKLDEWPDLQAAGNIANGVAICTYGHTLIVAPTQSDTLAWAPASGAYDTLMPDRAEGYMDMDGEGHTEKILAGIGTSTEYAAGFCNAYSRANANGAGLLAGAWWLPSLGELAFIRANLQRVNYAFSLISDAVQIGNVNLWSSSEMQSGNAWILGMGNGAPQAPTKTTASYRARPVCRFAKT